MTMGLALGETMELNTRYGVDEQECISEEQGQGQWVEKC